MAINRLNPDYPDAGLVQLVPTSIAVGSGSGSVNGNGQVSFSGSSSVSINDVFSSVYQNYKILLEYSTGTAGTGVDLKLRVNGADASTNYNYQALTVDGTSVGASRTTGATTGFQISITGTAAQNFAEITLINPFLTATTSGTSIASSSFNTVYTRSYFF